MSNRKAVITEPCIAVCDTACIDACPVDCIHGPMELDQIRAITGEERSTRMARLAGIQMFVNPNECIGCWACIPVCPVNAIVEDDEVPEHWHCYIAMNAEFFGA